MDILKIFKLDNKDIEINIIGTINEPLFQAKQIGELIGIKNIRQNLMSFDNTQKKIVQTMTNGGLQDVMYLTEIGLYKILGRSNKPIANTFQVWMINVIKEIRLNGKYELNNKNEVDIKMIKHNYELINHNNLLKSFLNKNVVYICKLKYIDNKTLIKIGHTNDIKTRVGRIYESFENINVILLDVIECYNKVKFERFLHNDSYVKQFYYEMTNHNGEKSKETFLVNDIELDEILKIANNNQHKFQDNIQELINYEKEKINYEKEKNINYLIELEAKKNELEVKKNEVEAKKFEFESKKIELEIKKLNSKSEYNNNDNEDDNNDISSINSDNDDIDYSSAYFTMRKLKKKGTTPAVYKYDPSDLSKPIEEFDTPIELQRLYPDISQSPLRLAYKNNTIYKKFRWYFVKPNETLPETIPPTQEIERASTEVKYLAMIDIDKSKILRVFSSQKEAVEARHLKSRSFTRAINQYSISSGHYWKFFEDCPEEMKQEYLSHSKLPEKFVPSSGKQVQQIDPLTKKLIKTYNSKSEVTKLFQMSYATLNKFAGTDQIHNGYIWNFV